MVHFTFFTYVRIYILLKNYINLQLQGRHLGALKNLQHYMFLENDYCFQIIEFKLINNLKLLINYLAWPLREKCLIL